MKHIIDPSFQTSLDVAQEMQVYCSELEPLKNWSVLEILKQSPKYDIFLMRDAQRRKKILRREKGADAARVVANAEAEYKFVYRAMTGDSDKVAKCHFALPEHGLLCVSYIRGQLLFDFLLRAEEDKRIRLLKRSGGWLKLYIGDRKFIGDFSPGFWIKGIEKNQFPVEGDAAKYRDALKTRMLQMQDELTHYPLIKAAVHPRFTSNNLVFKNSIMTGFDITGKSWQPLARACAVFLAHHALFAHYDEKVRLNCGVGVEDFQAFFRNKLLPTDEQASLVRFFMYEQGIRFLTRDDLGASIEQRVAFAKRLLET